MSDLQQRLKFGNGLADDWTKSQDKGERKTIQNRLAQRKRSTDIRGKCASALVGRLTRLY